MQNGYVSAILMVNFMVFESYLNEAIIFLIHYSFIIKGFLLLFLFLRAHLTRVTQS